MSASRIDELEAKAFSVSNNDRSGSYSTVVLLVDAEAALAGWQIEKAELTARVERLEAARDHYRLTLAEYGRERDRDEVQITDLAFELVQRDAKIDDLERKLAATRAAREAVSKAITIIEPYCQDSEDQTMLEAALQWLQIATAALTEAGEGEK